MASDCATCHASAASAFASWAGGKFAHAATDTNCSSCHNGTTATGLTTPPHIPVTGVQCSNCHTNTAASFATYTMTPHGGQRQPLRLLPQRFVHRRGNHGRARYRVVPRPRRDRRPRLHHLPRQRGLGFTSWAGGKFTHAATDTNCSSCHNGTTATGLTTPPHIPVTGVQCSNCHTNTAASFVTYTMGHSAAVSASRCDSCHNGSYTGEGTKGALGTASLSRSRRDQRQRLHHLSRQRGLAFTSWAGGKFTHAATDTNCSSCHNGTTATGLKTPPHIPVTGVQCSNCHTNTAASFTTYTMGVPGHTAVSASRCDSCHNGSFTGEGTKGALGTASFPVTSRPTAATASPVTPARPRPSPAGRAARSPMRRPTPIARAATTAPPRPA